MTMSDQGGLLVGGTLVAPPGELERLARRYHIRRLALFGSAARGELGPDSDVDPLLNSGRARLFRCRWSRTWNRSV